jgi:hypothetical protein
MVPPASVDESVKLAVSPLVVNAKYALGVPPVAAALTVKPSVAVCVSDPDVPVTVTVALPVAAVLLALRVNVLDPVVLAGLNDAVTPDGSPDALNATLPLKPFCGEIVSVLVPLEPCAMLNDAGEAAIEKSGAGAVEDTAKIRSSDSS